MKAASFIFMSCMVLMCLPEQVRGELVTFPVVGEYDGSASGNVVDRDADFYEGNSSGAGDDASLVLKIDSFRTELLKAFSNGCGGVVNFDNEVILAGTQTDTFAASFGEQKKLIIKNVDHLRTDFSAPRIFVPVSGVESNGGFLSKSIKGKDRNIVGGTFNFTFDEQGFGAGEHVEAVGGTILGRNGADESAKWLLKATLDNGDIVAAIADMNFRSGNGRDDTFFGVRAPKGRYITGVMWISLTGNHSGLDSFAFITNGPPPKPQPVPADANDSSSSSDFFGFDTGGSGSGSSSSGTVGYSSLFGREKP